LRCYDQNVNKDNRYEYNRGNACLDKTFYFCSFMKHWIRYKAIETDSVRTSITFVHAGTNARGDK